MAGMPENGPSTDQPCIFCAISAGEAPASVVHEDETVVVFMDLNPVTPGHLLVVPREHVVGFDDLPAGTGARVWSVGHHVIPRYSGDGWRLNIEPRERERSVLDDHAKAVREALRSKP
jgi:diadenosine tetraphosphate (Ap4A) HIT family hydrolase